MTARDIDLTELTTELGPLAAVIADKLRTVPVRLGPHGTDDLIAELTLAVAVYVGRHVLPAEAAELRNPPHPTGREWRVETKWHDGRWRSYGAPWDNREEAHEDYADTVSRTSNKDFRLVRATTTYATEAQHTASTTKEPSK